MKSFETKLTSWRSEHYQSCNAARHCASLQICSARPVGIAGFEPAPFLCVRGVLCQLSYIPGIATRLGGAEPRSVSLSTKGVWPIRTVIASFLSKFAGVSSGNNDISFVTFAAHSTAQDILSGLYIIVNKVLFKSKNTLECWLIGFDRW